MHCIILAVVWQALMTINGIISAGEVILDPKNPSESQKLSSVDPFLTNMSSHAGFIRVSEKSEAFLFFWFFRSKNPNAGAPLIVWLQGQQGLSSLYGLFDEHGPIYMDMNSYTTKTRTLPWTKKYHVLYMDPHVDCGFSYSLNAKSSTTLEEIGIRIYAALRQFLLVFPEMRTNEMYLTGQFDCSKYVSIVCKENLAEENPKSRLNIKGLVIGGGFTFELEHPNYDNIYYQFGLLSSVDRDRMTQHIRLINSYLIGNQTIAAFAAINSFIARKVRDCGYATMLDARYTHTLQLSLAPIIATKPSFRKMVHVGERPFQNEMRFLAPITLHPVNQYLPAILDHYKLLLYNGQFDLLAPYAHTQTFLAKLSWNGCDAFYKAERKSWTVDGSLLGYWTTAGNVTHVLVRNAGHMVGRTQPVAIFHLLDHFVTGKF